MKNLLPPPFKVKMVERVRVLSAAERDAKIKQAHYNVFNLAADDVYIDLLTDSGTGAMSDRQWASLIRGDEAYAGGRSFYRLKDRVYNLLGHEALIPTHQGRGAEHILFSTLIKKPGLVVPNNTHFDTTRANIEQLGAKAVDLPCVQTQDVSVAHPFKGNMDVEALEALLQREGATRVPFVMMTITNNAGGGQPASMENLKAVQRVAARHKIPLFLDACRFAENCYFIQQREPGYANTPVKKIVREVFALARGATMSAKKDALVNVGGFISLAHEGALYNELCNRLILYEGFKTYGGLAGRDLEAMATGLDEVVQEDYLAFRTSQVALLEQLLLDNQVPLLRPAGGHAVYVDAGQFLPHIPRQQFPGQALVVALYREFGVRAVEIGSVMFPDPPPKLELVRLAVPRRVYTNDHIRFVGQALAQLYAGRHSIQGLRITQAPPYLRHFTAQFELAPTASTHTTPHTYTA